MEEQYFMSPLKMSAAVEETVMPGKHITVDGYLYEQLDRKPKGRRRLRKLISLHENLKLIIYS